MLLAGDFEDRTPAEKLGEKTSKIGMNEVAIGKDLPNFAIELANARIPVTELTKALSQAKVYSPTSASTMGYSDALAKTNLYRDVVLHAVVEAKRLGGYVTQPASARQKMLERGELYYRVLIDLKDKLQDPMARL